MEKGKHPCVYSRILAWSKNISPRSKYKYKSVNQACVKPFCVPLQTAQQEGTSVEDTEKSLTTANPLWPQWYRACQGL